MSRTGGEVSAKEHNEDRMRRAFSWLKKSRETSVTHEKFIFLWIAFNAAYGAEVIGVDANNDPVSEAHRFKKFLREIVRRDAGNKIQNVVWETYSGPIRVLLKNQYVFRPFWEFVQGTKTEKEWKKSFQIYNRRVERNLARNNIEPILLEIFYRLYTLRNQIFHGGTTFADGWGKSQLRDGSRIMASLVPIILNIMKTDIAQNPDSNVWGKVAYPRINQGPED